MLTLYPIVCDFCGYEMLTTTPDEAKEEDGFIECAMCKQVDSARLMEGEEKYSLANEALEVWKSVYHNDWKQQRLSALAKRQDKTYFADVEDALYELIDPQFVPEKPTPFEEAVGLKDGRHGEYEIIRGGGEASQPSPAATATDGLTKDKESSGHDEAPIQPSTKPLEDSDLGETFEIENEEAITRKPTRGEQIIEAMTGLTPQNCKFTKRGKPYVSALEDILGFDITARERDVAWAKIKSCPN